jgi:hypothetical protein
MKTCLLTAIAAVVLLGASAATAREKILVAAVIPYASADVGSPALQQ